MTNCDIFAQNIDRGYMLEPPHGSNQYTLSIFRANDVYPCIPLFFYIKIGSNLHRHVCMMIIHTGEQLYFCSVRSSSFTRVENLPVTVKQLHLVFDDLENNYTSFLLNHVFG